MNESTSYSLNQVRESIDGLDRKIVRLIAERQQWVVRAGTLKSNEASVRAPARVEQVIKKVRELAEDLGASPEVVESTYRAFISAFIDLELGIHQSQ